MNATEHVEKLIARTKLRKRKTLFIGEKLYDAFKKEQLIHRAFGSVGIRHRGIVIRPIREGLPA